MSDEINPWDNSGETIRDWTSRVLSRRPSDATGRTSQTGSSKEDHHLPFDA